VFFRRHEQPAAPEERLANIEGRLAQLEEKPDALKDLELRFEELQDKVLRWMQRANARKRSEPDVAERLEATPAAQAQTSWLERLDPVSRRIHERRLRGRRPGPPPGDGEEGQG
jgi:predicted nuclease with TOPRIM domain